MLALGMTACSSQPLSVPVAKRNVEAWEPTVRRDLRTESIWASCIVLPGRDELTVPSKEPVAEPKYTCDPPNLTSMIAKTASDKVQLAKAQATLKLAETSN
jgi:hypothetical protein